MKTQKWNRFLRTVALLLAITLICPILLGAAPAQAHAESETEVIAKEKTDEEVKAEEIPLISSAEAPNFISQEQIEELGHIARIPEGEALNTLVYQNKDGTRTKYITRDPIKYTDANGDVQFIDLSLVEKAEAYETAANDILLSIAKDAAKGVSVAGGGMAATLTAMPSNQDSSGNITTAPMVTTSVSNGAFTYHDLFGSGVDVKYTPLYNGVKEDIILEAYTGVSSFDFLLRTNGMTVFEDENGYYLAKEQDSAEQLRLGKVVAYDAKIRMREGTLLVTPIKEGEIYRLTVNVDDEFLKSPDTTYPVAIDPSLTVSDTTHGSGAIYDTPVYSGMPNSNFGNYQYNCIGYVDSSYKIGRVAIKLQGLINDSDYTKLSADAIQQVRFYVRDSSGSSAKTVNIYALRSLSSWTEGSLTWNNTLGNISSDLQASASIGNNAWTSFDITSLVKGWKNNTYSAASGFIMQGANETVGTNFISTEYGTSSYWPYVVMTYLGGGNGGGSNFDAAQSIAFGQSVSVSTVISNEKRYYKFTPSTSGNYLFYSTKTSGDPKIWLYNSNRTPLGNNDDSGGSTNFCITAYLSSGNPYYIELGHYDTKTGSYTMHMLREANPSHGTYNLKNVRTSHYMDIHGPVAQELLHQWNNYTSLQQKWVFSRESSGYYTIQSMYGDKKYAAISSDSASTNNVVLISEITDYARWRFFEDASGNVYLTPKKASGKVLCAPDYNVGTELQLAWISGISNQCSSWKLEKVVEPHTHFYKPTSYAPLSHPHLVTMQCECGDSTTHYSIEPACNICSADKKENKNTVMEIVSFVGLETDVGLIAPGLYAIECYITYTNQYISPTSILANYPKFATYSSSVVSYANPSPNSPSVNCVSSRSVTYYSDSGATMFNQSMRWDANSDSFSELPMVVHQFYEMPSYTITGAVFSMPSVAQSKEVSITSYFD